jgi:hypothetical protein
VREAHAAAPEPPAPAGPLSTPRALAYCVAAWAIPGAGHALLGRFRRAAVFFALVAGSFGLGLAHDGRLALSMSSQGEMGIGVPGTALRVSLSTLQAFANAAVGPADLIARRMVYGEVAYGVGDVATDRRERLLTTFRDRERSPVSTYGTAYLLTAGLMNILLILDVWDIAKGRKP